MQNAEVDIKQQISRELQKLKKFSKPKISLKWLSIGGTVPKTNENSFIVSKNDEINGKDNQIESNNQMEVEKNEKTEKNAEKLPKEIHLLQSPNVLLSQVFFFKIYFLFFNNFFFFFFFENEKNSKI